MRFTKLLLVPILAATAVLMAAPAHAADEWDSVSGLPANPQHCRDAYSPTGGGPADLYICWNDSLTSVYVGAYAADTEEDGYHVEAQIRYQVFTGGSWSGWHQRTPTYAAGVGTSAQAFYKARYVTRNVQGRGCVYNGNTQIHCNGWS